MKTRAPNTGRIRTLSLQQVVCATVGSLIALTIVVSLYIASYLTDSHMFKNSQESLKKDLALSYALIDQQYPGSWEVKNGKLYKGDTLINENFAIVDNIMAMTGDMVTVFQGDTRITTTVRDRQGKRILGTRAAPKVVETVLKKGKNYLGKADVAGVPYLTAYMPLKDATGRVIGMWFIGLSLDRVHAAVISVTRQLSLAGVVVFAIAILILILLTNSITDPLHRTATAFKQIAEGDLTVRIPPQRFRALAIMTEAANQMTARLCDLIVQLTRISKEFEAIFQGSGDAMRIIGTDFRIRAQNRRMVKLSGVPDDQAVGEKCFMSFRHPFCGGSKCIMHRILSGEELVEVETQMSCPDGKTVFVELIATPLRDETGKITGIIESFRDIEARKQMEEQLRYISMHDPMTGLYNRAYFEEEMRRVDLARQGPVSIFVVDVDGLKIINDTLGHQQGDELLKAATQAFRHGFRIGDCVARIGGDEFAAILPHTDHDTAKRICQRIRTAVTAYNNTANPIVPLSLSLGVATTSDPSINLSDLFREADNNMYREKLLSKTSVRNATVQALIAALEARDFVTKGHIDRLQHLAAALGEAIGLDEPRLANVRLLAQFHDIGKVGIPDCILFKPGPLTPEERREMQRHCEIGHRIALSSPVLAPIADLILKHHEWWNGEGYPLGLKGEEIPLECRILAIVDAYDAMTSDRPYHKAMPGEEAFRELLRCAGTQFDPSLVQKFISLNPLSIKADDGKPF